MDIQLIEFTSDPVTLKLIQDACDDYPDSEFLLLGYETYITLCVTLALQDHLPEIDWLEYVFDRAILIDPIIPKRITPTSSTAKHEALNSIRRKSLYGE